MSLDAIQDLIDWARANGAHLHNKVEVYNDQQFGISLRVRPGALPAGTGGLQSGSSVVSCPYSLSLSYLNGLGTLPTFQAKSVPFPSDFLNLTKHHVIGRFFLMHQYLMDKKSFWWPYIKSLPQPDEHDRLGTPVFFTNADLRWIKGTKLDPARIQLEEAWKSEWTHAVRLIDDNTEFAQWTGMWTWDLYKWAATIFSSRSFGSSLIPDEVLQSLVPVSGDIIEHPPQSGPDPFPVLFPLVDLANHSPHAKVTWFQDVQVEPKNLSIIVDSHITPGAQIFNNYAPKNNTQLLLGYGFCIPGNDDVPIEFKPLKDEFLDIRRKQLSNQGRGDVDPQQNIFHVRQTPYSHPAENQKIPEFAFFESGFVDNLAICVANHRELSFFKENPQYRPEIDATLDGLLARNTLNVLSAIHDLLSRDLSELSALEDSLGEPETQRQRTAQIYRLGQTSTLRNVLEFTNKRLKCSSLDSLNTDQNIEVLTLKNAFDWLRDFSFRIWETVIKAIGEELEVASDPIDWHELIAEGWDHGLWCLWLYVVSAIQFFEKSPTALNIATKTLKIYNAMPTPNFENWGFQQFHGEIDEEETLEFIINKIDLLSSSTISRSLVEEKGGASHVNRQLLNFASAIAKEEGIDLDPQTTNCEKNGRDIHNEVRQRALCLYKMGTKKE